MLAIITKIIRNIRNRNLILAIQKKFYINFSSLKPNRNLIIAGVARSGTTWLSQIINFDNSYRLVFEPLHRRVEHYEDVFRENQYIRPSNKDEKYIKYMETIIKGELRDKWVDHLNKKIIARKRLIKLIRGNLLLKWLHINHPDINIVYIIRHPIAVAYSQTKMNYYHNLELLLNQEELMEDYLYEFKELISNNQKTLFEKLILFWSINNYVIKKQFKEDEILRIFYEDLVSNPEDEIDRLFSHLNLKYNKKVFKMVEKPSHTASKYLNLTKVPVPEWKSHITEKQIKKVKEIIGAFELDFGRYEF